MSSSDEEDHLDSVGRNRGLQTETELPPPPPPPPVTSIVTPTSARVASVRQTVSRNLFKSNNETEGLRNARKRPSHVLALVQSNDDNITSSSVPTEPGEPNVLAPETPTQESLTDVNGEAEGSGRKRPKPVESK